MVLTYTIKPNVYGGMACHLLKVLYTVNNTSSIVAFQGGVSL